MTSNFSMPWGDGFYRFALPLHLAVELENVLDAGIARIAGRVYSDEYSIKDITETLRLSLVGGGTVPDRAAELVAVYLQHEGLVKGRLIAMTVLEALFSGDEPEAHPAMDEDEGDLDLTIPEDEHVIGVRS